MLKDEVAPDKTAVRPAPKRKAKGAERAMPTTFVDGARPAQPGCSNPSVGPLRGPVVGTPRTAALPTLRLL